MHFQKVHYVEFVHDKSILCSWVMNAGTALSKHQMLANVCKQLTAPHTYSHAHEVWDCATSITIILIYCLDYY